MNIYPLRTLFWEATLRCNAKCEFCGSNCGIEAADNELSSEEICRAFLNISQKYDPRKIMVNVTGGEPLIRQDLFQVMDYVSGLGFSWGLVTNGMLITEETIRRMKQSSMKTISISIDGLEGTHNAIRKVNNGFQRVIDSIHKLKQANFTDIIMITTVISQNNIHELESLRNYMLGLPIDIWRLCPVDPIGRAEENEKLMLKPKQLKELFNFIEECRSRPMPFEVRTSCSHYLGEYETIVRDYPFRCYAGINTGSILSNGDIFVCPNVPRIQELIQGNVRRDDFVWVWENRFKCYRDLSVRCRENCRRCENFPDCRGDSLHTWDFEKSKPKFCPKEQGLISHKSMKDNLPQTTLSEVFEQVRKERRVFDNFSPGSSPSKDLVIAKQKGTWELMNYFQWGKKQTSVEKLAALYGSIYKNSEIEGGKIYVIESVVGIPDVEADEETIFMTDEILQRCKKILKKKSNICFLGFAHSHPNGMEAAMSVGDYRLHKKIYYSNDFLALSIIINPQKKQILAYSGLAANNVGFHVLSSNTPL